MIDDDPDWLDAYRFHEREWESYEQLLQEFEWTVPETFNAATYLCDRWAERDPEKVVLYATDSDGERHEHTYGEFQRAANRLANYLRERGVGRGDRVAVNGPQKFEVIVTHVAAWKLGAVSVPLSILLGPEGLEYRLADSETVAFVADETSLPALREIRDQLPALETVLTVDAEPQGDEREFWAALDGESEQFETVETSADDDGCMIYTSGTTGQPKGARHAHRAVLGTLPATLAGRYNLEIRPDDRSRGAVEWSWIGTLHIGIFCELFYGIPIIAHAESEFDAEREFRLIEEYDATLMGGPATAYRMMMTVDDATERFDTTSMRVITQGGESLGERLYDQLTGTFPNASVHEVYGQTEAPMFVGDCSALGVDHRPGKLGRPYPGHEVAVLDPETMQPAEPDEVGEIALRYDTDDPMPFVEYWNEPAKTEKKVREGWLLCEDLGSVDEDGFLRFEGRKDDVIMCSGYKVGPEEVEECLLGHEAVDGAAVIGIPDETRGEIPKAYVVLREGYDPSDGLTEELRTHVRDRLAKYEYPRAFEYIDELPLTTTGKIRRYDLRKREGLV